MNYLKIIGAIMLCMSASFYGMYKNIRLKNNIKFFNEYKMFLMNLKKYIYFYSLNIDEIFLRSKDLFSVAMSKNKKIDSFFLNNDDNISVQNFLQNLGRTDKDEELLRIENEENFCDERIREERQSFKEKSKINLLFYTFIGLAVALVLL